MIKLKNFLVFVAIFGISFSPALIYAQTIAQEELAGRAVYDKLQSKQAICSNLIDDDFEVLGDYFMGQMMGNSHETMDNLMSQRMGENNNRLMHIALGKRLSGCDPSANFPSQGTGFLPMMGMMGDPIIIISQEILIL